MALEPERYLDAVPPPDDRPAPLPDAPPVEMDKAPYSPWRTLRPRAWEIEVAEGDYGGTSLLIGAFGADIVVENYRPGVAKRLGIDKYYDRAGATLEMKKIVDRRYGWASVLAASTLRLSVLRWFVAADTNDNAMSDRPPFCSEACAWADRVGGGLDPVPFLADRLTEPADLTRSHVYRYLFTLVP